MALSVEFGLTDGLRSAIDAVRSNLQELRGLVCVVEKERLDVVGEPLPTSDSVAADFAKIREVLSKHEAAFFILSWEGKLTLVTYTPETLKPKTRMVYAASSSHLRSEAKIVGDTHIAKLDELTPALYGHKDTDRKELRSEQEVAKDEIAALQAKDAALGGQKQHAMHGINSSVASDVSEAAQSVKGGKLQAATFSLGPKSEVILDKSVATGASLSDIGAVVSTEEPRYVLASKDDTLLFITVVPEACKPKVRMVYAASKSSFLKQLEEADVKPSRRTELADPSAFAAHVTEFLEAKPLEEEEEAKPAAPAAKTGMKGPRMFMPA